MRLYVLELFWSLYRAGSLNLGAQGGWLFAQLFRSSVRSINSRLLLKEREYGSQTCVDLQTFIRQIHQTLFQAQPFVGTRTQFTAQRLSVKWPFENLSKWFLLPNTLHCPTLTYKTSSLVKIVTSFGHSRLNVIFLTVTLLLELLLIFQSYR